MRDELCEWDPLRNQLATETMLLTNPPKRHRQGCPNQATLLVGSGPRNWHLCASCAALPGFKRVTHRRPLPGAVQENQL